MGKTMIDLKCAECGKEFARYLSEHKRSIRLERREFCCMTCAAIWSNRTNPRPGRPDNLRNAIHTDEFSPFRKHRHSIKWHCKDSGKEFSITLNNLKAQWEKQGGICPYTGWNLINPPTVTAWLKLPYPRSPKLASVDRIDSSIGYVPSNIQFIATIANYAKHEYTEKQLREFCDAVSHNGI